MTNLTASYDKHHLTFHRYARNPKNSIAVCSCGWTTSGPTRLVYDRAASHDQSGFMIIPEAANDRT